VNLKVMSWVSGVQYSSVAAADPAANAPADRLTVDASQTAPVAQIARDLGISESCLRNWMARADVEEGRREGLTSDERKELERLRRDKRRLERMRSCAGAAALFAEEISPK
jgi:transposase